MRPIVRDREAIVSIGGGVRGDEREGTDGLCGPRPRGRGSKSREDIRGWVRPQCPQQGSVSSASKAALERVWVCQGRLGQRGRDDGSAGGWPRC